MDFFFFKKNIFSPSRLCKFHMHIHSFHLPPTLILTLTVCLSKVFDSTRDIWNSILIRIHQTLSSLTLFLAYRKASLSWRISEKTAFAYAERSWWGFLMNLLKSRNLLKGFLPIYALKIMHTKGLCNKRYIPSIITD